MSSTLASHWVLRVPIAAVISVAEMSVVHAAPAPEAETSAPEESAQVRAREAYARGSAAYAEARFEDALAAFQEASALMASPDFLFNIGLCYEQLGRYEDAARTFESYLAANPKAADSAAIDARIERLRQEQERVEAAAESQPQPQRGPAEPTKDQPRRQPQRSGRPLLAIGIVTTAVGAGIAAAGIVPSLVATRRRDAVESVNAGNSRGYTAPQVRQLQADAETARTQQIALFATGGALTVAGLVMTVVGARRKRQVTAAVSTRFVGLQVGGRF